MTLADADVADRVQRALDAIEADSPEYGALLQVLLDSPPALAALSSQPELGRALFVELRKLRPLALWVRDDATRALATKRALSLDGAICRLAQGEQLPAPEGRECWLEVDASHAETALRALPSGWGVIVTGDLRGLSFALLRRAAPLRALGAVLETPAPELLAALGSTRLDVLVVRAGSAPAQLPAARLMWSVRGLDELPLGAPPRASAGAVCDEKNALAWALRLATVRARSAR